MNFFVTGNGAIKAGINREFISPAGSGCGVFASKGQTLRQSYDTAENIFRLVDKGKINFVLIGLTADSLFRNEDEDLTADVFEENLSALNAYLKLCLDNDSKPVAVILPFAPSVRENYRENFLNPLLNILAEFEKDYGFEIINLFDFKIREEYFSDETYLSEGGATVTSIFLTLNLRDLKIFSEENFYHMPYSYFHILSQFIPKDSFHSLMNQIFSATVKKLRRKKKIRFAFVTDHAATWCGDELYNLFAQDPRFETTVFLCRGHESTFEDTRHDLEQLKSSGINAIGILDLNEETPPQDVILFLRPYSVNFSKNFRFNALTPQTLLIHIPYGINVIMSMNGPYINQPLLRLAWKNFFGTEDSRKFHDEKCAVGVPNSLVSGYPKQDIFFEDANKFSFAWKMTSPDAKKIIWAPHHSFGREDKSHNYSTFPYNFQFMYEFAKAHPEISWAVKPHPRLLLNAVQKGLFPSVAAYEKYMQAWNDLPNALVYTGAYYQDIFATSDGMILDSISFILEYQYTHKPLIFLTNDNLSGFTELTEKILSVSYIVDGKNHKDIAAAIQKIFIEDNDPLFGERMKIFNAELDYQKANGMSASKFIYKNISQELAIE